MPQHLPTDVSTLSSLHDILLLLTVAVKHARLTPSHQGLRCHAETGNARECESSNEGWNLFCIA